MRRTSTANALPSAKLLFLGGFCSRLQLWPSSTSLVCNKGKKRRCLLEFFPWRKRRTEPIQESVNAHKYFWLGLWILCQSVKFLQRRSKQHPSIWLPWRAWPEGFPAFNSLAWGFHDRKDSLLLVLRVSHGHWSCSSSCAPNDLHHSGSFPEKSSHAALGGESLLPCSQSEAMQAAVKSQQTWKRMFHIRTTAPFYRIFSQLKVENVQQSGQFTSPRMVYPV